MKNLIGKRVLVTTSGWFYASDGIAYRAVWGTLRAVYTSQEDFGFTPSRANTNWAIEIGDMVIMGCQVLYFMCCDERPNSGPANTALYNVADGLKTIERPCEIWISE